MRRKKAKNPYAAPSNPLTLMNPTRNKIIAAIIVKIPGKFRKSEEKFNLLNSQVNKITNTPGTRDTNNGPPIIITKPTPFL